MSIIICNLLIIFPILIVIIIIILILIIILIIIARSDGVFMSRLVDRGGPERQEIILNCVLQIQKYKVG